MTTDNPDISTPPPGGDIPPEGHVSTGSLSEAEVPISTSAETELDPDASAPEEPSKAGEKVSSDSSSEKDPPPGEQEIDVGEAENVNITDKGDINNTVINNIYGKDSDKIRSEIPDESFSDPTQSLPSNPSKLAVFHSPEELNTYRKKWNKNRLLLLGGINEDILLSTAYQLMETRRYETYEKRQLTFDDYNSELTGLKLEMFRRYCIGPGEKMIVLIDIEEQGEFFDSMFKSITSAQSIKEYLQEKDVLLIAMVKNHLMTLVEEKEGKGFYFSYWKIDFLPHLLRNFFPENVDDLKGKILEQRDKELWGDKNDDYDFHDNISAELKKGNESFSAEIDKRQKSVHTFERPDELFGSTWKTRTRDIFKDFEPHKTVLYCGAFFSKLPPLDFDKMVRLLLNGKIAAIGKTAKIITDTGEDKTIETNEQKEAVDIWTENSDKILKECKLRVTRDDSSSQYIGFSQPYLENDLKKFFQEDQPMYMRHQFRPIQESGILFVSDISPNISNNIVRLATQMAILNPAYYGADWLKDFIRQLREKFDIQDTVSTTPEAAVFRFMENTKNKIIRRHFYTQISKLIREMLNHHQLKVVIKKFLNHLFTIDAHDAVLHIVLNIGNRMFPARRSEFDMFYWLKRLLDQGPESIKVETYEALHQIAIKHHQDIYIVLESIFDWVPDPGKKNINPSPSNQFSLIFIIHYCYGTLLRMKDKHYGRWPSNYPVFRPLYKDKSQLEQLEKIICWLLHPHTHKSAKDSNTSIHPGNRTESGSNFDLFEYIASILEEWGMILMGWDYESGEPGAVKLFHTLTGRIISITDPSQHNKIFLSLAKKRIDYKNQFTQITDKKSGKRKKLISRYKMLHMLIGLCKKLIADQDRRKTL
jgi:hypothetical protein